MITRGLGGTNLVIFGYAELMEIIQELIFTMLTGGEMGGVYQGVFSHG